jgi:molybdenum cofactor cytidylyltransferase
VIPAVVLAAGKSTRMGRPKALLPVVVDCPGDPTGADTFLTRIVRSLHEAGVEEVIVVLGHDAPAIEDRLRQLGLPARVVLNPDYESGQLSSFLTGLHAAARPDVEALLVTLVDVPLVSASTIRAVVARYRERRAPVVRPVNGLAHGHPVLIDRALFPLLDQADPAQGIKPIVRAHVSAAGDVEVQDPDSFLDVDTPEEYALFLARFQAGGASRGSRGSRGSR